MARPPLTSTLLVAAGAWIAVHLAVPPGLAAENPPVVLKGSDSAAKAGKKAQAGKKTGTAKPQAATGKKPNAKKPDLRKTPGIVLPASLKPLLTDADRALYKEAFAKARDGKWADVQKLAGRAKEQLPAKLLRALELASSGDYATVVDFIAQNPDWPYQNGLRLRAEDQSQGQPAELVLEWFKRFPPIGTKGNLALAQAMVSVGRVDAANALVRQAWINANFDAAEERAFLDRYRGILTDKDDIARLDRLLWDDQVPAARRMMTRVEEPYRHLAEARIRLMRREGGVDTIVAKVPEALRTDPGLVFERLRYRRRQSDYEGARELLVNLPHDLRRPGEWWTELSYVIRRTLGAGDVSLAYRIAKDHRQDGGPSLAEAEFLAGWIALRSLNDAVEARQHFQTLYGAVKYPVSLARAAYWSGRAADAAQDPVAAQDWYRRGAKHVTTFYGQLSARRLGEDPANFFAPEPAPTAEQISRFERGELARLTRMMAEIDERERVKLMFRHLAQNAGTPSDFALVARLATAMDMLDQAVRVSRRAEREAVPLTTLGYPLLKFKQPDDGLDPALVHALIRQESGFDRQAVSSAGARGLMQLMPDTARLVAKELKVGYQPHTLTEDPAYNVTLGRAYLKSMIDDMGGVPGALAAYNAGPSRAKRWTRENGDPRGDEDSLVDWVESIPFDETRNYVQRVLESAFVYRLRLGQPTPPLPAARAASATQ
ncbi:MAG: lytic transglycosylase domain-containing protein [Alphaproteobacteria bacterium]|nr:lytic transglycosylase domain-containing protein [Alphaproteobacteria bacterium]